MGSIALVESSMCLLTVVLLSLIPKVGGDQLGLILLWLFPHEEMTRNLLKKILRTLLLLKDPWYFQLQGLIVILVKLLVYFNLFSLQIPTSVPKLQRMLSLQVSGMQDYQKLRVFN